jgi:hypothetical protein
MSINPEMNRSDNGSDSASTTSVEKKTPIAPSNILQDAQLVTAHGNIITKDGIVVSTQESDASLSTNIFSDPEVEAYYVALYEKAQYECRHVLDGKLTWTPEEEKALVRKLDWRGRRDIPHQEIRS